MNRTIYIFCDASVHQSSMLGVGSYLILAANSASDLTPPSTTEIKFTTAKVSSNVRMELMTVLAALTHCFDNACAGESESRPDVTIYTDSKAVCSLPERRQKLESKEFLSSKTKKTLANADLYQEYFAFCDRFQLKSVWLKGHQPKHTRDNIQEIFALVDRSARKHLRELVDL